MLLLLLLIAGTALAAIPAAYLSGLGMRGMPKGALRTLWRLMLVTPVAIVFGTGTTLIAYNLADNGRWECLVCAKEEHHQSWAGFVYFRTPRPPNEFESWFRREIGGDHEHDWVPVGCHQRGNVIACHFAGLGGTLRASLPKLPDQKLAISLASRVLNASESKREAMLIAMREEPFHSIAYGDANSVEDFDAAYAAWLDRHPEWK